MLVDFIIDTFAEVDVLIAPVVVVVAVAVEEL